MEIVGDEQTCIEQLRALRWKDGEFCPYCGSDDIWHFSDDKTHKCVDCRQRFSIKVGTIFEDTKLPLRKWFIAIHSITQDGGISSVALAKKLSVTQKTAWWMMRKLRTAARSRDFNYVPAFMGDMTNVVEMPKRPTRPSP